MHRLSTGYPQAMHRISTELCTYPQVMHMWITLSTGYQQDIHRLSTWHMTYPQPMHILYIWHVYNYTVIHTLTPLTVHIHSVSTAREWQKILIHISVHRGRRYPQSYAQWGEIPTRSPHFCFVGGKPPVENCQSRGRLAGLLAGPKPLMNKAFLPPKRTTCQKEGGSYSL